jgi:hypothetical protein
VSAEIIPFFLAQLATKEITPPALFSPDAGTASLDEVERILI